MVFASKIVPAPASTAGLMVAVGCLSTGTIKPAACNCSVNLRRSALLPIATNAIGYSLRCFLQLPSVSSTPGRSVLSSRNAIFSNTPIASAVSRTTCPCPPAPSISRFICFGAFCGRSTLSVFEHTTDAKSARQYCAKRFTITSGRLFCPRYVQRLYISTPASSFCRMNA